MREDKRGQIMGLPFSVIFSIILIIFFIVAAIIAIKIFWNPSGCGVSDNSQEALFKDYLQRTIDDVWNSDSVTDLPFNVSLASKITYVCFLDINSNATGVNSDFYNELERFSSGKYNFFLYPPRNACVDFRGMTLNHINITEITKNNNPYCIKNKKTMFLTRDFYGGSLVRIR